MIESPTSPPPLPSEATPPRTSRLAIASLVLGILSFFLIFLTSIPAIICGIVALVKIGNSRGQLTGKGLATSGIVMGALLTLLLPAILLPALARAREAARRASCQNNLMQMSLIYRMYANESEGEFYPGLSSDPESLTCSTKDVYPKYLTDLYTLTCPSDGGADVQPTGPAPKEVAVHQSYTYLGYVIMNEDELEAFAEVYRERVARGLSFNEDLQAPPGRGSMGTDTFYRFREGVEWNFVADKNDPAEGERMRSTIPVMWDKAEVSSFIARFNHIPGGSNVVFMDGHVEFIRYPDSWPMTRRAMEILGEMQALRP